MTEFYSISLLNSLSTDVAERIEELFVRLGINFYPSHKMYGGACCVHGGDNLTACNLYFLTEPIYHWKCRTHRCENVFGKSLICFVRGVMSHQKYGWRREGDRTVSFQDAVKFLLNFTSGNYEDVEINTEEVEKQSFTNSRRILQEKENFTKISRHIVRENLEIPATPFIERGFTSRILDNYDVGVCNTGAMKDRIVVPIYDETYNYSIGCTARSIHPQCEKCKCYHNGTPCPEHSPKWKHSFGLRTGETLYNIWFAREHIVKTKTVILVEGPLDVLRLVQNGIRNVVAIFGTSLSYGQKKILDKVGCMNIVILTDNDAAGKIGADAIEQMCGRIYRIYRVGLNQSDPGEMNQAEVESDILPVLRRIKNLERLK